MRKNVLIFGHGFATQFIDVNNQYTKLFDKNQYDTTVVYLTGEPNEAVREKHLADRVVFLNSPKKSVRGFKWDAIKRMTTLCQEKSFEIVICHRYKPTYVMLWVTRQLGISPLIISVTHEIGALNTWPRKLMLGLLASNKVVFAGVSNAVRDDMANTLWRIPRERIITLYNMIDIDLTEPQFLSRSAARQHWHLSPDSFVFGNIGRLAKNKDQKTLIQAFATIKNECPHSKLIIMGDGELEIELKELTQQLKVERDVLFTGFVPDAFRFMKAFDVLISASIQEAFGRVLLEAMLAKLPIIATAVNGVPEVIAQSGVLIPAEDPSRLAAEMVKAYHQDKTSLNEWGEKGYQRVKHHFSLERFNEIFWQLPFIPQEMIP